LWVAKVHPLFLFAEKFYRIACGLGHYIEDRHLF
jgi:hypothetical protein